MSEEQFQVLLQYFVQGYEERHQHLSWTLEVLFFCPRYLVLLQLA